MAIHIQAYRGRTSYHDISITDDEGNLVIPADDDVVRLKIGAQGSTPLFEVGSDEESDNGSWLHNEADETEGRTTQLRFDGADVATLKAGLYDCEAGIVDADDEGGDDGLTPAFKHAEMGIISIIETQTGDTGLE